MPIQEFWAGLPGCSAEELCWWIFSSPSLIPCHWTALGLKAWDSTQRMFQGCSCSYSLIAHGAALQFALCMWHWNYTAESHPSAPRASAVWALQWCWAALPLRSSEPVWLPVLPELRPHAEAQVGTAESLLNSEHTKIIDNSLQKCLFKLPDCQEDLLLNYWYHRRTNPWGFGQTNCILLPGQRPGVETAQSTNSHNRKLL